MSLNYRDRPPPDSSDQSHRAVNYRRNRSETMNDNPTEGESESENSNGEMYEAEVETKKATITIRHGDRGELERRVEKARKMQTLAELASDLGFKMEIDNRIQTIASSSSDNWAPMSPSNARELADLLNNYADLVERIGALPKNTRYPDDYPDREDLEWKEEPETPEGSSAADW